MLFIDYFLNLINLNKTNCQVIFIIDTCYGKNFIKNNKSKYIFIKNFSIFSFLFR